MSKIKIYTVSDGYGEPESFKTLSEVTDRISEYAEELDEDYQDTVLIRISWIEEADYDALPENE